MQHSPSRDGALETQAALTLHGLRFPEHREGFRSLDWAAPPGRIGLRTCPCVLRALVTPGHVASATAWGRPLREALTEGELAIVPARLPGAAQMRVLDCLTESLQWIGAGRREAREALERLGIEQLARTRCGGLSPRQERLVALAHGIASGPKTLLLSDWLFLASDEDQEALAETLLSWDGDFIATLPSSSRVTPRLAESCDAVFEWTSAGLEEQSTARCHFFLRTKESSRIALERLAGAGFCVRASQNRSWLLVENVASAELEAALESNQLTPLALHLADARTTFYCASGSGPELV